VNVRWGVLIASALAVNPVAQASTATGARVLESARNALREGIPQVAIRKLQKVVSDEALDNPTRDAAMLLLAEAQRASGSRAEALTTLDALNSPGAGSLKLRADILASDGRWEEALSAYREVVALPGARIGEAESLQALGRTHEAIAVLEPLMESGALSVAAQLRLASLYVEARDAGRAREQLRRIAPMEAVDRLWHHYVRARLFLLERQFEPALAEFQLVLNTTENLGANLLAAATLGVAECRIALTGWETADKPLEALLSRYAENGSIELVFRRLDQIYAQQRRPGDSELQKWASRAQPRRAALAIYYLARLQIRGGKAEKALSTLDAFTQRFPEHGLVARVHIMRADIFLGRHRLAEAVAALEAAERQVREETLRAEIELRKGLVQFEQGEFVLAAASLDRAASKAPELRSIATFNAALAWLNQGNDQRFSDALAKLDNRGSEAGRHGQLMLEQGLVQARQMDGRASETLAQFVHDFPAHARGAEARLAMAELALDAGDSTGALENFKLVRENAARTPLADEADYFAIFLAEGTAANDPSRSSRDNAEVIKLAKAFLRDHPKSAFVGDVRMKLGEVFFQERDFANAETQFANLARENPEGEYAAKALFLAGESAMQMIDGKAAERALDYFDEVAKRRGLLALYAREQQAILQGRLGKETEAIALYEVILSAQPSAEAELRYAAICGKGDNLLARGRREPEQLTIALSVFEELAGDEKAPLRWRNQALYKKAKALEQLNRRAAALEAYYDLLEQTVNVEVGSDAVPEREYFWFYKAGFDAARRFEEKRDWRAAIGIYEKMTKLDGPRATEARERTKQLRLEHFIWE